MSDWLGPACRAVSHRHVVPWVLSLLRRILWLSVIAVISKHIWRGFCVIPKIRKGCRCSLTDVQEGFPTVPWCFTAHSLWAAFAWGSLPVLFGKLYLLTHRLKLDRASNHLVQGAWPRSPSSTLIRFSTIGLLVILHRFRHRQIWHHCVLALNILISFLVVESLLLLLLLQTFVW